MIHQSGNYARKEIRERKDRLRRMGTRRAIDDLEDLLRMNRFFTGGSPRPFPVGYSRLLRPRHPR
ncbi:MAG: hypothetical protein HYU99_01050 [Deltaproteobacteria bacterium]|nr:hypothetical protein [Deltaproteobacteria bacterium]